MPFQIKDFSSIVAAQINHARAVTEKITDFQPGSVARTLMEAPAVEVEELYLQMFLGLRDAIPVATFRSFGFDRLPAAVAHGFVSVSATPAPAQAIAIPAGTAFSAADGRTYTSTEAVAWAAGASVVRVPVRFSAPGLAGNISAGLITSSPLFGAGYTVSNSAIETGRDEETDAEREVRFADFVGSLSRGTVMACLYAARLSRVLDADGNVDEYVTRSGIYERGGIVRIYLYSNRGIPSAALLADGQLRLDGSRDDSLGVITPGFRPAGVRVDVLPMAERAVSLSVRVEMFPGFTLDAAVEQRLGDIFGQAVRNALPGAVLYLGTLVELMLETPGVKAIVPVTNENILCSVGEALLPGTLTVEAL